MIELKVIETAAPVLPDIDVLRSTYGWWITDTGVFIDVRNESGHATTALKHFSGVDAKNGFPEVQAMDGGWVRIVAPIRSGRTAAIEWTGTMGRYSREAVMALINAYSDMSVLDAVVIDSPNNNDRISWINQHLHPERQLQIVLRTKG